MNISIITVHKDDFSGLAKTNASLRAFWSKEKIEWIVIDGASNPIDEEQRQVLDDVRQLSDVFVSEADSGIYAAMNKGTNLAKGQYLLYLNAGDCLHPDFSLARISGNLQQADPDMIWGSYDESGKSNQISSILPRSKKWLWWGMPCSHQAILFHREFLGSDPYDESLQIAGDYDLLIKLVKKGASIATTTTPVCIADGTGISNTRQQAALIEQMAVRKRHFGTTDVVNQFVTTAHRVSGWLGRFGSLRKLWR